VELVELVALALALVDPAIQDAAEPGGGHKADISDSYRTNL